MRRHQARGHVLGLEVGPAAVTCVAVAPAGGGQDLVVTRSLTPEPGEDDRPGLDPSLLLAACDDALRTCAGAVGGRVAAIGLSTASTAIVGLDRSGRALTGLTVDADSRAVELATGLRRMPVGLHLLRATGRPVDPRCPLVGLMWWQDRDPQLCGRVHAWVDLKGLVVHHLTRDLAVDRSSASATGLLELVRGDWHEGVLELAGVVPEQLPRLVEAGEVLEVAPAAAVRAGLPPGTVVVAGAASSACHVLGVAAARAGGAVLSLDGGAALHAVGDGHLPDPLTEGLSCSLLWGKRWMVGGGLGAASVPREENTARTLELAGRTPPGSDGLTVLPRLADEATAVWEGDLPGAVLGLRPHHRSEHLARAVFEGRAWQVAALLDAVVRLTDVDQVVAERGTLRHRWQLETLAAVLARPVDVAVGRRPAALGAAALALHGVGCAQTPEAACDMLPRPARYDRVAPDPVLVALYAERRRGLADLTEGVRGLAGRLSRTGTVLARPGRAG